MPYPYPWYTDGPDAESHICAFVSTWQANHSMQQLTAAEIEASKIADSHYLSKDPTPFSRTNFGYSLCQERRIACTEDLTGSLVKSVGS